MSGLAYRLDAETPEGKMFTVDGLTYRFWAYTRILFAFLVFFSAYLFDSHPFFRNFCCILTPALGCLDLISNIAYANQIYCRDRGICETEQALYDTYVDMWWRDIISFGATVRLASVVQSYYVIVLWDSSTSVECVPIVCLPVLVSVTSDSGFQRVCKALSGFQSTAFLPFLCATNQSSH